MRDGGGFCHSPLHCCISNDVESCPGIDKIRECEPDSYCECAREEIIHHDLHADPAEPRRFDTCRTCNQGEKYDRNNDHLQKTDEQIAEELCLIHERLDGIREKPSKHNSYCRTENKACQYPNQQVCLEIPAEYSVFFSVFLHGFIASIHENRLSRHDSGVT